MNRKLSFVFAALLAAACGGGIKHTKVTTPQLTDLKDAELAKVGRITSMRENGGTLFIGAEKGLAAVDGGGKVLWTIPLPEATARLVEADADGVVFDSFTADGVVEGGAVSAFLMGEMGDEPHFKDQQVGAATRDGKLLFTAPAKADITRMSPPGLSKDQFAISRGRDLEIFSRADGREVGRGELSGTSSLTDSVMLNASFNRPVFVGSSWYGAHLSNFVKLDTTGAERDRTRMWSLFLALENLTVGPMVFKDRMILGAAPAEGGKRPGIFAFDKDGGKDWKEFVDDKSSGAGALAANSKLLFAATNFHVAAMNEKGSTRWSQVNDHGGLYPSKYRGLRFMRNFGARRSQGQLLLADEKNVYVATSYQDHDALTVLNADTGEYQGSLALGTFVVDMAMVGPKIALATEDGLRFVDAL